MDQHSTEVPYMARTRAYYRALGYPKDYVWSHHTDVPFTQLPRPLSEMRLALITTASPIDHANADRRGIRHIWSAPITPPPAALDTNNLAWDKQSTHTNDIESFLPLAAAQAHAAQSQVTGGRFAALAPRFHGIPTEYSQRKTIETDAPELLQRLRDDNAEGAILCPI